MPATSPSQSQQKQTLDLGQEGRLPWFWKSPSYTTKPIPLSLSIWRSRGLPGDASGKKPACQCRRCKRCGLDPWVGKIPWRRAWQPTPVFLPRESRGPEEPGRPMVHRAAKSRTWLEWHSTHACMWSSKWIGAHQRLGGKSVCPLEPHTRRKAEGTSQGKYGHCCWRTTNRCQLLSIVWQGNREKENNNFNSVWKVCWWRHAWGIMGFQRQSS